MLSRAVNVGWALPILLGWLVVVTEIGVVAVVAAGSLFLTVVHLSELE